MKGFIYYLKCPKTNKIRYVGQTISILKNRLKNHIYETKRNIKLNKFLTHKENWINGLIKDGLENKITIELIEECELDIIDERERFWIEHFKNPQLTNIDAGGKRTILTEETKKKISIANSGSRNGMFGKRFKISDEEKERRRIAMIKSEKFQTSRKSNEYKQKISISQKVDDWLLLDINKKIIETFNNSREVSEYLGCTKANVKNARRDKRLLLKKYWVVYKQDYDNIL